MAIALWHPPKLWLDWLASQAKRGQREAVRGTILGLMDLLGLAAGGLVAQLLLYPQQRTHILAGLH